MVSISKFNKKSITPKNILWNIIVFLEEALSKIFGTLFKGTIAEKIL